MNRQRFERLFLRGWLSLLVGVIGMSVNEQATVPATSSVPKVRIGPNGELLVNSKPFLPVFVWMQPPHLFDFHKNLGVNTVMGETARKDVTAKQFLDACLEKGLWGVIHATESNKPLKDHPALLAWMFGDEPDLPGKDKQQPRVSPDEIAKQYRAWKSFDPDRPVYLNLTARFLPQYRFFAPFYTDGLYRRYAEATDIIGYDHYPIYGWGKPERVPEIAEATAFLRQLAGDRLPVWVILETTRGGQWTPPDMRAPFPFEIRAQVFMAIVNGAKGIGYFPHVFRPRYNWCDIPEENRAEMKRINAQLTALAPVILAPDSPRRIGVDPVDAGRVDVLVKEHDGKLYMFTVSLERKSLRVRFRLPPDVTAKELEVYGEGRRLPTVNHGFEDTYSELSVRIYVVPLEGGKR